MDCALPAVLSGARKTGSGSRSIKVPSGPGGGVCYGLGSGLPGRPRLVGSLLVSVRKQVESSESFVIQVWWPDSRRVTDVDGEEPQTIRPQRTTISERSDRR